MEFNTAYVVQPVGHSFAALLDYCEEVKFITTGYHSSYAQLVSQVQEALQDYDAEKDILVPVGNVTTNLIVGMQIMQCLQNSPSKFFNIAYYKDKDYVIQKHPVLMSEKP